MMPRPFSRVTAHLTPPPELSSDRFANRPLRHCHKHNGLAIPEGGVDLGRERWSCAKCWAKRFLRQYHGN